MVFKKYPNGVYRLELTRLLRKRLCIKDKLRYHTRKIKELKRKIPTIEKEIDAMIKKTEGKA